MKKKWLPLLTVALSVSLLASCGKSSSQDTNDKAAENTQADDTESGSESESSGGSETTRTAEPQADKIVYDVDDYVTLGDYSNLKVTLTDSYDVTQADIEEYAQGMAEYYAGPVYKDTDKKTVESGDTVNIDYVGKKGGVAFDGGTASGYNLTIGSGSFIDGFEDGLIGKKVGETVDLNLTFPENYQSEELAGQAVVFTVTINKIVEEDESAQVELTDQFVAANFGYDTVDEYYTKVKEYLETTNEQSKAQSIRNEVLNQLKDICEVTFPDGLLEAKIADYIVQFTYVNCKNSDLETYLQSVYNMSEEEFKDEITEEIKENQTVELLLEAIAKKENLTLSEEDYEQYVQEQMTAGSFETEEDFYLANGVNAESGEKYERKVCLLNQALDLVISNADISYDDSGEQE